MEDHIIISKFITQNLLEMKDTNDGKYVTICGSNVVKSYEKINGLKFNLERTNKGYTLFVSTPNKFTKKICNFLDNVYQAYICYFKAKMIETLLSSRIDCSSTDDLLKNIINVELYLESNKFYAYNERVFIHSDNLESYKNNVFYPLNASLEKININGGIIVDKSLQWFTCLAKNNQKNLVLTIGGVPLNINENYDRKVKVLNIHETIPEEIIDKYDRIFFDCSQIESLEELASMLYQNRLIYNKIKSKNKWIVINELPIIADITLDIVNFICGKNINYPIMGSECNEEINPKTMLNGLILNFCVKNKRSSKVNITREKINFDECENYIIKNLPTNISYDIVDELNSIDFAIELDDLDCPICTETIENKYICRTKCGHLFCIRCIILSLNEKHRCPICRCNISMNEVLINRIGESSKIKAIISRVKKIPKESKIIIYIKNQVLIKNIYNFLKEEYNVINCTGTKHNKLRIINDFNGSIDKFIIILQSKDYDLSKYIHCVKYILISDYDYKYVTNKISMGYDFYNNISDIHLIILEH